MTSQMNTKQTPIGDIPEEWEVVKLGDDRFFEIVSGGTPSTKVAEYWEPGEVLWATPTDITSIKVNTINNTQKKISKKGLNNSSAKLLPPGSVLMTSRATVGEVAINTVPMCTNQGFQSFVCKDYVNNYFLLYSLKLSKAKITRLGGQSTFKEVSKPLLKKFQIPLPSLPEQRRIASVLSTVDIAIQKVDDAIVKTERLKQGLMQRLLTEGLGHKRFKDTKIGRMPKEWEVVRLGNESIAEIRGNKSINRFDKVAFIPMEAVPDSGFSVNFEIRPMKDVKSFTYCERGDILLAKITPSLENGKQGIVPDNVPNGFALATTEVFPISCKNIERLFLFYVLKSLRFRNKIIASMTGTTGRQRATKVSVKNLKIPLPPLPEQKKIASILSTVDKKLELEHKRKEKLDRIKKGLMNDLLTGSKRVKVEAA